MKLGGGNAGHNGLRSITALCGNDYRRVRLGIGHPGDKALVHAYVLNDFAKSEEPWVEISAAPPPTMPRCSRRARMRASRTRSTSPWPARLGWVKTPAEAGRAKANRRE